MMYLQHDGFSIKFEDPDLMRTSAFALVLSQQISLVDLTRELIEPRIDAAIGSPV
jgi:hypothetical protein